MEEPTTLVLRAKEEELHSEWGKRSVRNFGPFLAAFCLFTTGRISTHAVVYCVACGPRSPAHSRNVSAGIILIVNSSAVLQSSAVLCCITALMPEYVHQDRTNRTFVNQMQL